MSHKRAHNRSKKDRPCPNPLFLQWLTEWYQAAADVGSKMQFVYAKAIDSLQKYPVPLSSGKEAKILQGFGDKICKMLDKKLMEQGITPRSPEIPEQHESVRNEISQPVGEQQTKKRRVVAKRPGGGNKSKEYIPTYRSGAYAIILALYNNLQRADSRGYMSKAELTRDAQLLCDASFSQPDPGCRYTAWSSMGTLIKKGYVLKESSPAKYSLTDTGCELADRLQSVVAPPYGETAPSFTIGGTASVHRTTGDCSTANLPNTSSQVTLSSDDDDDDEDRQQLITGQNNGKDDDGMMGGSSKSQNAVLPQRGTDYCSGNSQSSVGLDCFSGSGHYRDTSLTSDVTSSQSTVASRSESDLQSSCSVTPATDFRPEFVLQPGAFDIVLCVDNCETAGGVNSRKQNLVPELQRNGINFDVRKLQIGDFLWVAKEKVKPKPGCLQVPVAREVVLDYVAERKRMDDLASSIMDGRFKEQKFRLKNCGLKKPIYLVEDFGCSQNLSIPETTLRQAIVNTQVIDGFLIKQTHSLKESVGYLTIMTRYLQSLYTNKTLVACTKEQRDSLQNESYTSDHRHILMTFGEFNELSIKNKAMTVTEMFAKQLMQISGLSAEKAKVVLEKYRTPKQLIEAYQSCQSVAAKEKLLSLLKYGKSQRNLGPSLSKSVYQLYNAEGSLQ